MDLICFTPPHVHQLTDTFHIGPKLRKIFPGDDELREITGRLGESDLAFKWSEKRLQENVSLIKKASENAGDVTQQEDLAPTYVQHLVVHPADAGPAVLDVEQWISAHLTNGIGFLDRIVAVLTWFREKELLFWPELDAGASKKQSIRIRGNLEKWFAKKCESDGITYKKEIDLIRRWRNDRVHVRHLYVMAERDSAVAPPLLFYTDAMNGSELAKGLYKWKISHGEVIRASAALRALNRGCMDESVSRLKALGYPAA